MGTALLAGASVASVVIGLAAQSTLGNLVAGIAITIYRPFRLGDTLQVATPTGTDIGVVELTVTGIHDSARAGGAPHRLAQQQRGQPGASQFELDVHAVADRHHDSVEQKYRPGGRSPPGIERGRGKGRREVRDRMFPDEDGRCLDHLGIASRGAGRRRQGCPSIEIDRRSRASLRRTALRPRQRRYAVFFLRRHNVRAFFA